MATTSSSTKPTTAATTPAATAATTTTTTTPAATTTTTTPAKTAECATPADSVLTSAGAAASPTSPDKQHTTEPQPQAKTVKVVDPHIFKSLGTGMFAMGPVDDKHMVQIVVDTGPSGGGHGTFRVYPVHSLAMMKGQMYACATKDGTSEWNPGQAPLDITYAAQIVVEDPAAPAHAAGMFDCANANKLAHHTCVMGIVVGAPTAQNITSKKSGKSFVKNMVPILVADKDEKLHQAALVTWGAIQESNFRLKSVVMAWGVQREVSQFSACVVFNTETWSLVEPNVNNAAATRLKSLHAKQEAAAQQVQFVFSDPSIRVVGGGGAGAGAAAASSSSSSSSAVKKAKVVVVADEDNKP